jgi:hypothetical protein
MHISMYAELVRRYPKFFRPTGKRWKSSAVISDFENRLVDDRAPFDERGIECDDVGSAWLIERCLRKRN